MYIISCLTSIQILLIGVYSADVRLPPTIIRSPVESKIFRADDEIVLECLASGIPQPNYEWLKNGHILQFPSLQGNLHQINEGTILIKPLTSLDEGYYQCTAWNQFGRTMSNVTNLRRAIFDQPSPNINIFESDWIEEGMPYMLQCLQTKFYPKPTYSWAITKERIDETQVPIPTGKRIQIDEQGNLHFSYVTVADAQDGKLYKCNMYNAHLDVTTGGSYSRLKVRPSPNGIKSFGPVLKFSSSTPTVALEGRNVTIRCFFSANPEPSVAWARREPVSLPIGRYEIKNFNTELMLQRVQQSDEGEYRCTAHNSRGSNFYSIHIDVQAAPVFLSINDRPHNRNVTEGTSPLVIFCRAHADPEAKVVWLRDGEPIDFELNPKYRLSDNNKQLTISNICKNCPDSTTDLAVIQCNASNVHGYAFSDGYINILEKTSIIVKPEDIYIEEGELTARFYCEAKSDDSTPVTIDWYRVSEYDDIGDERVRNISHKVIISSDFSLTFNVDNYTEWIHYRGRYRCQARNGYSVDSAEASLDAYDLPLPPAPVETVLAGLGDLWWIFLIVAIIMLILILLICCCICLQRNKGDTYPVDEKERRNGNDPEKELSAGGFHDYQRPEGEPLKGSRASLSSSIKMDSDEEASLNEYGELDAGKFTEDGSFIGDYGVEKRRGKAGDHQV